MLPIPYTVLDRNTFNAPFGWKSNLISSVVQDRIFIEESQN
jgi:hypothetical protein